MTKKVLERITIDHNSPVPLFYQFYFEIMALIKSGVLGPGSILPTEKEFCEHFNVSRVLLRKAMKKLVNEQIVLRIKGKGSFIREDLDFVSKPNYGWIPLTTIIESGGRQPHAEIVSLTKELPPIVIRSLLNIGEHKQISILKRLYFADDQVCALNYFYLIQDIKWDLQALGVGSLTKYLSTHHGINVINATLKLTVEYADREIAEIMRVPIKTPLMRLFGINRGKYGEIISGDYTYYVADKTEMYFKVDQNTPIKWTKLF